MKNIKNDSPIILLGAGRSGTKFLRDVLNSSDDVSVIPYDVGYVWRYGNEKINHDEFTPKMVNGRNLKFIKKILPKLVKQKSYYSKPYIWIEKSVPNTLRPAFINSIYPNAKFIHLIRDGRAVSESSLRLWKTPPEKKYLFDKIKYFPIENYKYAFSYIVNLLKNKVNPQSNTRIWGPRYKGIQDDLKTLPLETICARQWRKCVETSLLQLGQLDKERVLEVRYEDLMSNSEQIELICNFINIKDTNKVVKFYESLVNKNNLDKWCKNLNNDQLKLILKEIKIINNNLGYK